MFSLKNFTWKKWVTLTVLIFLVTTAIVWLSRLIWPPEPVFEMTAVIRRLIISALIALVISMQRSEPKD
jgi:uncharacterized membrane protein